MRSPATSLKVRLQSRPQAFNLFQAISLLERVRPDRLPVGTGRGVDEAVSLRAEVSLSFAASDVVAIQVPEQDGHVPVLISSAMSLAGASGPLPLPFTEDLLQRQARKSRAALDFLDIFHNRWLAFLYRSRKKHAPGLNWQAHLSDPPLARTMDALSGLGRHEGARGPAQELAHLKHAGLQNAAPRSMVNLLALISDRLKLRLQGRQFVGGWHRLSVQDMPPLGRAVLGHNAVLGLRAWDTAAGIEISLCNTPMTRLPDLLPGGADHALMDWLVSRHAQAELQVRLVLHVDPRSVTEWPSLGKARLGWNSWLTAGPGAPEGAALRPIVTRLQRTLAAPST